MNVFEGYEEGSPLAFEIMPLEDEVLKKVIARNQGKDYKPGEEKFTLPHACTPEKLQAMFLRIDAVLEEYGFGAEVFGSPAEMLESLSKRLRPDIEPPPLVSNVVDNVAETWAQNFKIKEDQRLAHASFCRGVLWKEQSLIG